MAVKSRDELMTALKGILGDTPTDEGIALLDDVNDTFANLTGEGSAEYWRNKCNQTDAAWRKRYVERFNEPVDPEGNNKNNIDNDKPLTFESLFKEV